jgi:hypothetical protein
VLTLQSSDFVATRLPAPPPRPRVKRYVYDQRADAFLDKHDEHNILQLLTTELIAKCRGYPAF